MPGNGHVRFGGRSRGRGPAQAAPRRVTDPTRHLVKDRLDITGARWSLSGAEAVLKLRALRANGDFEAYWAWHEQQEFARNHQARYDDRLILTA
jgi:hypothetical protein